MPRTTVNDLVNAAKESLEELTVSELKSEISSDTCIAIDIRDFRERLLEGTIPGSVSAPRGMIEWWFDPESPYHKEGFNLEDRFVLFCSLGWRSALAASTLQDLGFHNVAHLASGFTGWVEANGDVELVTSGGKWFNSSDDIIASLIDD
ncbi:MAG: rhodanese-like domain-containing protein [Acidimicrobiales bacterium]|jgi:rhodanese-related sulfurtransferase|nr:rhodanese-like domain-containing protein [Acidimicrobiales bacterium]MDP6298482.1 rhodanese-like domain-containing protein [Acidimicrobiales bacterium]HJM28181.1 rhodanese-like domain-containing protein [Acidimicrobiales bacterium]HJM97163.1 rhodanese-like domain-containing protein [Acidimicrobiales bacterium]